MRATITAGRRPGRRSRATVIAFIAALMVGAIFFGPRLSTHAQVTGTCTPQLSSTLTIGSEVTCVLVTGETNATPTASGTGISVAPGGTMTISLTNPVGAAFVPPYITGSVLTTPGTAAGCFLTPVPPPPVMTLTIDCAVASEGIPAGTELTETVQLANTPATPFVTETVTYNANGATSGGFSVPAPSANSGTCDPLPPTAGGMATCTNTPSVQTVPGGTLTLAVSLPSGSTQTMRITATNPSGTYGSCPITTPLPTAAGTTASVTITCGTGQATPPPPAPITLTLQAVTSAASGTAATSGTCTAYDVAGNSTCLNVPGQTTTGLGVLVLTITAPQAGSPSPPSETTGTCTTYGPTAPFISACTNTPGMPVPQGGSIVLEIQAPTGGDIETISSPPGPAGTCPLSNTTPLPSPVVEITFTCGPGQSAPMLPIPVTVTGDGPGSSTPAETTFAYASVATHILSVTPQPDVGTCGPDTVSPTPGPMVSVVTVRYVCAPGESTSPPTPPAPVVTLLTGDGAPGTSPSESTTSTSPGAPSTLTETTTANANGPVTAGTAPPVQTAGNCGALALGVGSTTTCSNTPGAPGAFAGGQLTLTVAAAPGQTIAITAAPPSVGSCPLTTTVPTSVSNPGGVVSVAYTCGPGAATVIPLVNITVTDENGVPGTPSELTTVSTVNVTTGVPAPTTVEVTFEIGPATATPVTGETPTGMTLIADPEVTVPNQGITFTAAAMTPNFVGTATANIAQFRFAFGDGQFQVVPAQFTGASESATALHTYTTPGVYIAVVQAVDSTGETNTASTTVTIKPDTSYLSLYGPLPAGLATAGTAVKVTLTIQSQQIISSGTQVGFTWTAVTQVNPALSFGYSLPPSNGGQNPQSLVINWGDGSAPQPVPVTPVDKTLYHTYTSAGQYTATLTATDTLGNAGTGSATLYLPQLPAGYSPPGPAGLATATPSPTATPSSAPAASTPTTGSSAGSTNTFNSSPGGGGSGATQATAYLDPPTGSYYVVLAFCAYDSSNNPAANTNETLDFAATDGTDLGTTTVSTGSEGCFSGNVQPDGSGKMTQAAKITTSDSSGATYTFAVTPGSPSSKPATGPIH